MVCCFACLSNTFGLPNIVLILFTTSRLSQWYLTGELNSIRKYLQYYFREVGADNTPNIAALCECILLIIQKSGLVSSIVIFSFLIGDDPSSSGF